MLAGNFARRIIVEGGTVTCSHASAVHNDLTTGNLNPGVTSARKTMVHGFAGLQDRGVQTSVLVNGDRTLVAIGRGDDAKLVQFFFCGKSFLLVTRSQAILLRQNPDLKQMHRLRGGRIELAIQNTGTSATSLHVTWANGRTVSQAVFVGQSPFQHVGDNFHVAMRRSEEHTSEL